MSAATESAAEPAAHDCIEGGAEQSSYPARCVVALERRTLPGETAADVEGEPAALVDRCAHDDPELVAALRMGLAREPFEVSADAAIVTAMTAAAGLPCA